MYAEIILPVPLPRYFTYLVPEPLQPFVAAGKRVVVSFGKRRLLAGLVRRISDHYSGEGVPKEILSVLDEKPLLQEYHFRFWEWMAEYYLCTPGEIMVAALPSGFRLESETRISLNPSFNGDTTSLSDKEYLIVEALQYADSLPISQIAEIVGHPKVMNLIQGLIEKDCIVSTENMADAYRPKTVTMIRLKAHLHSDEALRILLDNLSSRAYKQMSVLMIFLQSAGDLRETFMMTRKELLTLSGGGAGALDALVSKGILEELAVEVSRLGEFASTRLPEGIVLSEEQTFALQQVKSGFGQQKPVLLHGVTGSGKTEIYIRLIQEVLESGRQVLYILPEIALTSQIINRLREYFGNRVQVYHSRTSESERTELWNKIIGFSGEPNDPFVLVGARSALFLPVTHPGLIIVDEEHDHSFKQFDPAPRYQARDSAVMLSVQLSIPILLGSATPALESYHNALTGKYHLVILPNRYGSSVLPEVQVADLTEARRNKQMKSHYSELLLDHIGNALASKRQVILFQNRRGFSLRVICESCGWYPACPHCDVSLTYHKFINKMKCHYCGYQENVPTLCSDCASTEIRTTGFGTEKIEEEISQLFPEAVVRRMDFDTTRTKNAYQTILEEFEAQKTHILIGTQMVTKGLDFSRVGVVGVLDADSMIAFPDFRSWERSFQHIVQVSGRAGRQSVKGVVVIQTYKPSHDVIRLARQHNYQGLYAIQIQERKQFSYPPFTRLVRIVCKSRDNSLLNEASFMLAKSCRSATGAVVLGPEYPIVSRIKDEYIRHILIKLNPENHPGHRKKQIRKEVDTLQAMPQYRKVRFVIDVDPY